MRAAPARAIGNESQQDRTLELHDDTPKHMYAAMGFLPLYVERTWTKKPATGESAPLHDA